ncbi:MAG TPA: Nif3-like dinuclear metal center hexameric protein [Baekduia sp.]|uniref:Nif3-like dinuclear metal center hexameric protein n=1 Tax=Baekduia sp. TaxID=2600305 RepID=UPI002C014D8A|nr:Nif3-like dinuclear metal center hexameric protein [Baekduia sp.]HMJ32338.1 Nif3-like dinuclear metal center hexameric protein [Baekduia sp.]
MPAISEIVDHLDRLLEVDAFRDYCPNGLQVPTDADVQTIVTGVSANVDLLDRAAAEGADLVLVHHGLFWRGEPLEITPLKRRRLAPLFAADIGLAAYHLPLDGHPEHGNNALIAAGLGATTEGRFAEQGGRPIGVHVRFAGDGLTIDELTERVQALVGGRAPLVVAGGPERIRTLGIVSGAATDDVHGAIDLGLDAFLTGEPAERAFSIARDAGIHFLAAGHHATETFGVRRLGELLEREYGIRHVFVDVPNPI